MPTAFPDVLLPDVLDFLQLEWLLLCAMPVSRFWRNEVIGHPTYWRDIIARDGLDGRIEFVESVDMFLLRISRSHDRPISVALYLDDPSPVLESLAQHIRHVRDLKIITTIPKGENVLEALRHSPAPILENLTLRFLLDINFRPPRIMPHDLFAADAPALRFSHLENIALASPEFPPCLASVTNLVLHIFNLFADDSLRRLPNVFAHCPDLVSLSIGGNFLLDHAAFRDAASWARLTTLALAGPRLGAGWDIFRLPISYVPSIALQRVDAHGIAALAGMLGDRLSLELLLVEDMRDARVPIKAFLRKLSDAPHLVRRIDIDIPHSPPGAFPIDGITAFQRAPVTDAVVHLVLSLHNWYDLVGLGYLGALPVLEILDITLDQLQFGWPLGAQLGCPSLQRLVLRAPPDATGISVAVEDVAEFVSTALADATLPLELDLEGVEMEGHVTGEYRSLFKAPTLV